jgi:hypothetical protein
MKNIALSTLAGLILLPTSSFAYEIMNNSQTAPGDYSGEVWAISLEPGADGYTLDYNHNLEGGMGGFLMDFVVVPENDKESDKAIITLEYTESWEIKTNFHSDNLNDFDYSFDYQPLPDPITKTFSVGIGEEFSFETVIKNNFAPTLTIAENPVLVDQFNRGSASFEIFRSINYDIKITSVKPVPEPATMLLFGTGVAGLLGSRLRKRKENE